MIVPACNRIFWNWSTTFCVTYSKKFYRKVRPWNFWGKLKKKSLSLLQNWQGDHVTYLFTSNHAKFEKIVESLIFKHNKCRLWENTIEDVVFGGNINRGRVFGGG